MPKRRRTTPYRRTTPARRALGIVVEPEAPPLRKTRMPLVKEFRHGVSKTRLGRVCVRGGPVPPLVVLLAGYDRPGVV